MEDICSIAVTHHTTSFKPISFHLKFLEYVNKYSYLVEDACRLIVTAFFLVLPLEDIIGVQKRTFSLKKKGLPSCDPTYSLGSVSFSNFKKLFLNK